MKIDLSTKVLVATTAVLLTGALASMQAALVIVQPTAAALTTAGGTSGDAYVDTSLDNARSGYGFEYNPLYTPTVGSGSTFDNGQTVTSTANTPTSVYPWFTIGHYEGTYYLGRINGAASGFAGSVITFTLDQAYTLNGIFLWNYAETYAGNYYNGRGLNSVTVGLYNGASLLSSQAVTFNGAAYGNAYSQANYQTLTATANVNKVTFTINTNLNGVAGSVVEFGGSQTTGYVGLGEVRFTAVPEPSALALIGLAAAGMILRRRRK